MAPADFRARHRALSGDRSAERRCHPRSGWFFYAIDDGQGGKNMRRTFSIDMQCAIFVGSIFLFFFTSSVIQIAHAASAI